MDLRRQVSGDECLIFAHESFGSAQVPSKRLSFRGSARNLNDSRESTSTEVNRLEFSLRQAQDRPSNTPRNDNRQEGDSFPSDLRPETRNPKLPESGFTLIELVVVIAILGILVAIAVPVIAGFLGSSKEQAYNADQKLIQVSVDAYYSSPSNERLLGKRQYPVVGKSNGGTTNSLLEGDVISPITYPGTTATNPVGGIQGGFPNWIEGRLQANDGIRNQPESEPLYHHNTTVADDDHWKSVLVPLQSIAYVVDSRDYFIDFCELIRAGFIDEIPRSASPDHHDCDGIGTGTGSYTWFIDPAGKVRSLYYFYPNLDSQDYQDVYP